MAFLSETNKRMYTRLETLELPDHGGELVYSLSRATSADRDVYDDPLHDDEAMFLDAMFSTLEDACPDELVAHVVSTTVDDIDQTICNNVPLTYYSACFFMPSDTSGEILASIDRLTRFWSKRAHRRAVEHVDGAYQFKRMIMYALNRVE
jgi:hypothetical protein